MSSKSNHCLLLVEDDELVRDTIAMMLLDEGFEVTEAASADVALRLLQDGLDVPVIVTDIDLGGGASGTELADLLHWMRPNLRVIFITGRAASLNDRARDEREAVLPKPFESLALSSLIRRMASD